MHITRYVEHAKRAPLCVFFWSDYPIQFSTASIFVIHAIAPFLRWQAHELDRQIISVEEAFRHICKRHTVPFPSLSAPSDFRS